MTQTSSERDRIESFIEAIDHYSPKGNGLSKIFPLFSRFLSRSIDARYIAQHPVPDLLETISDILTSTLKRERQEILVKILPDADLPNKRATLLVCMPTQPFITSTIRLALEKLKITGGRHISTVVPIERDAKSTITQIGLNNSPKETIYWQTIENAELGKRHELITSSIKSRLNAAQSAVQDFPQMQECLEQIAHNYEQAANQGDANAANFAGNARLLRWMLNERFVVLGMQSLAQKKVQSNGQISLGIGRTEGGPSIEFDQNSAKSWMQSDETNIHIRKSQTESWIYRSGHTDHVYIRTLDAENKPDGALLIEGLFSFQALAEAPTGVPFLDNISNSLYEKLQATKGSHHYRTIRNAFNSLPLDFLFSLSVDHIAALIEQILNVGSQKRTQVDLRYNPEQGFTFLFVALPRPNYSEDLRAEVLSLLSTKFPQSSFTEGVYAGDKDFVGLHFFVTNAPSLPEKEEQELKEKIDLLASPWSERLETELSERHPLKKAKELFALYKNAFSRQYQEQTSVTRTVNDISILENLDKNNNIDCDIYREAIDAETEIARIRLFSRERILLSNILPILDNLGLIAIEQFPANVEVPGRKEYFIATFRVRPATTPPINLLSRRNRLRAAIQALLLGAMTNDPLNKLLLAADIPWTYVVLIRAYERYARQLGLPYNRQTYENALLAHPNTVRSMTELFRSQFDPDFEGLSPEGVDKARETAITNATRHISELLGGVTDLTTDQILQVFFQMIRATLRTNFYQRDPLRDFHLALKFDPKSIPTMPEPYPYREILVHHPKVVGLHLRGGQLARGGIRWSDRNLDFRTEVLGLMATQNLKNVLIVPKGAKGAFVLLDPPQDLDERRAAADELYKIFIRGLLDVTDNLIDGKIQKPKRVLCHDGDDPYLVVAADKGTAHLSDTANQVAQQSDFWLNDAFASGGSQGYDHKKEAITARGAWECVKRHFYERGVDPEKDCIRVIGIGDMSGDVFGNGMLRSKSMQLVAAFDHRHVFIDPDPDPKKSFSARLKLFKQGRSTWEDYPKELISKGGGIFPRSAKAIELSPEMQNMLRIQAKSLSGPELIKKVLTAQADLLWNGGIGTYIKSSAENNHDIGDPANDQVRVDANKVLAKVIGEGGNLGISPAGRIELAAQGVKLNTDYIDNSAGVDLSDHEVNLKILFELALSRKEMSIEERDGWLEKIREEVNAQVLSNNWVQSRIISLDAIRSQQDMPRFQRTIEFLCDQVPFKRRDYYLPGERVVNERAEKGLGLYRPELAAIISNAKMFMRQELSVGQAPDFEKIADEYMAYFPKAISEGFRDDLLAHPLRDEIANAVLTNHIMADTGSCFLSEASILTGRSTHDIIDAFFLAQKFLDLSGIKSKIDKKKEILNARSEYALRLELGDALEDITHWILRRVPPKEIDVFIKNFHKCAKGLRAKLPKDLNKLLTGHFKPLRKKGVSEEFDDLLTPILSTHLILDCCSLQQKVKVKDTDAIKLISAIGKAIDLNGALYLNTETHNSTDKPARFAIKDLIRRQVVTLAENFIKESGDAALDEQSIRKWLRDIQQEFRSISGQRDALPGLVIAADRLQRHLYALNR